ncbi:hypothetical protein HYFRA_00009831 [Hymenoscyphus fraxineus]|uniref:Uncharacterized protein n=1 Tax=Hymenoscyphus fraxineus TaxID=746836 RepID=A0A9N9L4N6_9HELO|nr:hypothetical protein HYFRA_00009831 [Hymenoscyphus fraxineus]
MAVDEDQYQYQYQYSYTPYSSTSKGVKGRLFIILAGVPVLECSAPVYFYQSPAMAGLAGFAGFRGLERAQTP